MTSTKLKKFRSRLGTSETGIWYPRLCSPWRATSVARHWVRLRENGWLVLRFRFGAVEDGHAHFHSHMVAVLPGYRSHGGRRIKMAQRDDALRRGVQAIAWTFDPRQPRNANFNLVLLGGLGVRFIENLYAETSSPLHGGMPTDRLAVQWNLQSLRVLSALQGDPYRVAKDAKRVPIPPASEDVPLADRLAGQHALRERLLTLFQQGYTITSFEQGCR